MDRGFFGIGIEHGKFEGNLGTLFRSAQAFGASYIFTIGKRYNQQKGDTGKSYKNIPCFHFETFEEFEKARPKAAQVIGVEIGGGSHNLKSFRHPERAVYLLGAEDSGLSGEALKICDYVVEVPTNICLNVSVTGSIVMYDRSIK